MISDDHRKQNLSEPLLISAKTAAFLLGVSERTIWRRTSAGTMIKPIRQNGTTQWRLDELRKWVEEGCPPPTD